MIEEKLKTVNEIKDFKEAKKIIDSYLDLQRQLETPNRNGMIDALSALLSAKILGQPQGTAIYFAVDFDIEGDRDKDDEENRKIDRIKTYFDIFNKNNSCFE